jgi:hypothetical protein
VGISENVKRRKNDLECASGMPLELKYTTEHLLCPDRYETETHIMLHEFRQLGEWFNVDPELAIRAVETAIADATQDPVVERYKNGDTIASIAREAGVTRQAILSRLKGYGLYDKNGKIPEQRSVRHIRKREIVTSKVGNHLKWDVSNITIMDQIPLVKTENIENERHVEIPKGDSIFLDDTKPSLPLKGLKRFESNVNFNGEWYQAFVYCDGAFTYAYSQNINKARQFIVEVKARV